MSQTTVRGQSLSISTNWRYIGTFAAEVCKTQTRGRSCKKYLSQYNEFINLLFGGDIPSEGILKIEKQLGYNQFEKVLLKASSQGKKLSDLIGAMANTNKYTAGKKSLFLTLNSWLNRD